MEPKLSVMTEKRGIVAGLRHIASVSSETRTDPQLRPARPGTRLANNRAAEWNNHFMRGERNVALLFCERKFSGTSTPRAEFRRQRLHSPGRMQLNRVAQFRRARLWSSRNCTSSTQ